MKRDQKGLFSIMSRIDAMSNQFTKTDWKIVQYIKNNTQDFISCSAQNLASQIDISDASIIRFAQKIGFSGLNEFKYMLQTELEKESHLTNYDAYTLLLQDYTLMSEALFKLIVPENLDRLRKKLVKAHRIFIVGLNLNRNIAEIVAHKYSLLGFDVREITTIDSLKLYANLARKDDVFIIITLAGNHSLLAESIEPIVENDSYIVMISNYEKSLCSAYADLLFLIPKTNLLENHDTISREIFILMLFDIIFLHLLNEDENCYDNFQQIASFSKSNQPDTES
ncbi:MAG: MurR/RpiR family transcriptional regulator [Hespellia sp.]|nr:MurR/RpiR family transcriptional regulator [Hespellia sp.]